MPEWKSVALDGDEPADSPGAGGQDGPDAGGPGAEGDGAHLPDTGEKQ